MLLTREAKRVKGGVGATANPVELEPETVQLLEVEGVELTN